MSTVGSVCATGRRNARRGERRQDRGARTGASSRRRSPAGRAKIRRRLGVSPGPVGFSGPLIARLVDAGADRSSENRSSTPRAFALAHDGHADGVGPGGNLAARTVARRASGRTAAALAVERDLDRVVAADRRQPESRRRRARRGTRIRRRAGTRAAPAGRRACRAACPSRWSACDSPRGGLIRGDARRWSSGRPRPGG